MVDRADPNSRRLGVGERGVMLDSPLVRPTSQPEVRRPEVGHRVDYHRKRAERQEHQHFGTSAWVPEQVLVKNDIVQRPLLR